MNDLRVDETCDQCEQPINILVSDFEQAMKEGDSILCPDCETKVLDEQAESEKPPKRCFEYEIVSVEGTDFDHLGQNMWELVAIDNGLAYFKREYFYEKD